MKRKTVYLIIAILFSIALCYFFWSGRVREYRDSGTFTLLEQVVLDVRRYQGSRIKVICYLAESTEGRSLSTLPLSLSNYMDQASKVSKTRGTSMLAKTSDGWADCLPIQYFRNEQGTGETLLLVEGIVHASGYQEPGFLLEDEPYVQIQRVSLIHEIIVNDPVDKK